MNHDVTPLGAALTSKGYDVGVPLSIFGPKMQAAMRSYEKGAKLTISDDPTHELCDSLGITLGPDFPYQPIASKPQGTIAMNLSLFSLLLNLLPVLPMLEQDFELEVKNLTSSADGKVKAIQTLHLLEDASKKLRAALGDSAP